MLRHASGALRRVAARRQASTLILADHDGTNMTPSTLAAALSEARRVSGSHVDGVAATWHRVDAIDAATSSRRRHRRGR